MIQFWPLTDNQINRSRDQGGNQPWNVVRIVLSVAVNR